MGIRVREQWVWAGTDIPYPARAIGTDVSDAIYQRMMERQAQDHHPSFAELAPQSEQTKAVILQRFIPSARLEAIAQFQQQGDRGLILCDQRSATLQVFFVPMASSPLVLWMAHETTKQQIATLLEAYNTEEEAVVVMLTARSIQPLWVQANDQIRASQPQALTQAPIQIPSPVILQPQFTPEGFVTYHFIHPQLGLLGSMVLRGDTDEQLEYHCELLESNDGLTGTRTAIFRPLSQLIIQRLKQGRKKG